MNKILFESRASIVLYKKNLPGREIDLFYLSKAITIRLVEVENMKDELEKNHRDIVQQYKTTMTEEIEELNSRLREADSKNAELYEKISSTNRRLEEIILEKVKTIMHSE